MLMTKEQHNTFIAWAFAAHAGFQALILAVMLFMFSLPFWIEPGRGGPPPDFLFVIGAVMVLFQLLFIVPSAIASYGLLKHRSWARVAAITAGVISAVNVPFGTIACVYSLWFFLGENWRELYAPGVGKYASTAADREATEVAALLNEREARWTGMRTNAKGEITFHPVEPPDWR